MNDLRQEIIKKASLKCQEYLTTEIPTENKAKAVGINYLRFAIEQPQLFRLLFMTDNQTRANIYETDIAMSNKIIISTIQELYKIPYEMARQLTVNMWLLTHGIATIIVCGTAQFSMEQISKIMTNTFDGLLKELKGG